MSAAMASIPRRSTRVSADLAVSDGDTWRERITVCESATADGRPKLLIRSYYRNCRTDERVWDEPPSGAARVQHATPEMRTRAEVQLQELQLTLEMIPDDELLPTNMPGESQANRSKNQSKKKKNGLSFIKFWKKEKKPEVAESKDLNLQKAIARSMADTYGRGSGGRGREDPVVYYDDDSRRYAANTEDEDFAMAKALSMSDSGPLVSRYDYASSNTSMSEEEMLRRALEESRLEAHRNGIPDVAELPDDDEPYFIDDDDDRYDRKIPAVPVFGAR